MPGIVEQSRYKAQNQMLWTIEDHEALVIHLAKVSQLAQEAYNRQQSQRAVEEAARRVNEQW